jgi:site-specific DNA-methyltransferase (adenine-specific)
MNQTLKHTIGNSTLYCGDCAEIMADLSLIDVVITDPPYSTPVAISFGRETERSYGGLSIQRTYVKMLAAEWKRLQAKRLLIFCDDDYYPILHQVFYEWPFRQMAVWDKGRIGMGRCFRRQHELVIHAAPESPDDLNTWGGVTSHTSVLRFAPVGNSEREHGAQKPLPLLEYLVQAGSNPGQVILDPFMGSGTTGVACAELGRKFVGIEIEERYFEMACRRIEAAHDQKEMFIDPPLLPAA